MEPPRKKKKGSPSGNSSISDYFYFENSQNQNLINRTWEPCQGKKWSVERKTAIIQPLRGSSRRNRR